jgi:integrase/recombinase XerD
LTEVLRETTKLWRKHYLSYDQSRYVVEQVWHALKLSAPRERPRTMERLDKHEAERLIEAAYRKGSRYGLMVKTLFYTGAQVSECINIQVVDLRLDLEPPQVYIAIAKGGSELAFARLGPIGMSSTADAQPAGSPRHARQ